MKNLRSIPLCALAGALLCTVAAAQSAAPKVRIVSPIDNNELVTLKGNVNPHANAANDRGPVSAALPMTALIMVLSRSPEQQAAFDSYVQSEYDSSSPNYHHWLTPAQVGELYGPAPADIATISNWLVSHGLTVTQVANDRMSIRFSGNAGQVENTFHTEIHNLSVNGRAHIGNMTDPEIPEALAPVVVGVKNLHNFFPHPLHHMGKVVERNPQTGRWMRLPGSSAQPTLNPAAAALGGAKNPAAPALKGKPQFGIGVGATSTSSAYLVEDVGPWDFATIYNVAPLWSDGIDGTGQTIAIAGTSAIDAGNTAIAGANGYNDVAAFRNFFDLPTGNSWNTPIQISGNSEPLTVCTDTTGTLPYAQNPCGIDDLIENSLDVEWSGAVAKNAQIILVASYPSSVSDDNLYDSESYIVENHIAPIMNVSYGECELGQGTSGNVEYYNLWQTAAAEGISVFVAAGDSGSASCDDSEDEVYGNPYAAQFGLSVSGMASTPFNTAVGGTDFNWCPLLTAAGGTSGTAECSASPYWNASNNSTTQANAIGYVPEIPWNDTCTNTPLVQTYLNAEYAYYNSPPYTASNGTNYGVTDAETGCNWLSYYAENLYQGGDYSYALVDTVGGSGGASSCIVSTTSPNGDTFGSCTASTGAGSTGSSQGSLATYNNGWPKPAWQTGVTGIPSDGVRDIPDVSFFASDGSVSSSSYLVCVSQDSSAYGGNQPCSYSSSSEPMAQEVGGTSVASPAMAGVMALINQKMGAAQGLANPALYALAAKNSYTSGGTCSAENATTSDGCYFNDIDTGTNAMACNSGAESAYFGFGNVYDPAEYLEQESPNCTVLHTGDYAGILSGYNAAAGYDEATGLGSLNVANVVQNAPSGVWVAASANTTTVTVTPTSTSIVNTQSLSVTVSVTGSAGTAPSGTIALAGDGYAASQTIGSSSSCASNTSCTFTIAAGGLEAGSNVTLTAYYYGDSNYGENSGTTQISVTSTYSYALTAAAASPSSVTPGGTATSIITGATSTTDYTGTVTLSTCTQTGGPTTGTVPTCSVSGTIVYKSGAASGSGTATVTTYSANEALAHPGLGNGKGWLGGGAVLAFLVFLGIPARSKSWRAMLGTVVLLVTLGSLAACGGSSGNLSTGTGTSATVAGTYKFQVSGTGSDSAKTQGTGTFEVVVN